MVFDNGNKKFVLEYMRNPFLIVKNRIYWSKSKVSKGNFIFVLGAPRSGTTLIQRLISNHPSVLSFDGETSIFSPKNVFNYERFRHICEIKPFELAIEQSECLVSFFENLHKICLGSGMYYLEKTPQHIKRLNFLLHHFPNAKFIHVIRDPRDCYCSAVNGDNIPQSKRANSYVNYWKTCVNNRINSKSDRIYDVFYEDFVENPAPMLESIMDFIGLPFDVEQLISSKNEHDIRSREKAFSRLSEKVSNKTVGQWKTMLNEVEQSIFRDSVKIYDGLKEKRELGCSNLIS